MNPTSDDSRTALLIVDMQRYFLELDSSYCRYYLSTDPHSLKYLHERCESKVIPNLIRLRQYADRLGIKTVYLRLCSERVDRADLHSTFRMGHSRAMREGYPDFYPLSTDRMADITPPLAPRDHDLVIDKKTYSPFTWTDIHSRLRQLEIHRLLIAGLMTCQCVESTARDAVDRDYKVVLVEDALADILPLLHSASLYSSQVVCNGMILTTAQVLDELRKI